MIWYTIMITESQTMSDRDMLVVSYKSGRSRRSTGGEPIHSTPNPPPGKRALLTLCNARVGISCSDD